MAECSIGQRLKRERERLSYTQEQLARAADAGKRTLAAWEAGETSPTAVQLSALAAHGIDVLYVLTGERAAAHPPANQPAKSPLMQPQLSVGDAAVNYHIAQAQPDMRHPVGADVAIDDYVFVPRYNVAAYAGHGAKIESEDVIDYMAFRLDWIVGVMGLDVRWLALAQIANDSMRPTLDDGDLALLDRRPINHIRDGIYFLDIGGGLIVKRLQRLVDGSIDVISDNPKYRTENIPPNRLEQLHVFGRVVWQARRL